MQFAYTSRSFLCRAGISLLVLVLVSSCKGDRPRKFDATKYSASTLSFGVAKTRQCGAPVRSWKASRGPDGSLWRRTTAPDGWCEYRHGKVTSAWADADRTKAERTLVLTKGRAVLAYLPPKFDKPTNYVGEECAYPDTLLSIKHVAPTFGGLHPCQMANSSGHRLYYTLVKTPAGYMPIIILDPKTVRSTTVLYLQGGPYIDNVNDLDNLGLFAYVTSNYPNTKLIIPFYVGIPLVRVKYKSNIELSEIQILYLVRSMRFRHEITCAIGGSLGGYLLAGLDIPKVSRLLINPLLDSPENAVNRMKRAKFRDNIVHLTELSVNEWRSGSWSSTAIMSMQRSNAFTLYFGDSSGVSLMNRIEDGSSPVTVIYGSEDKTIGLGEVPALRRRLGRTRLTNVGPVGHEIEGPESFWAMKPSLDRFLSECGRQKSAHLSANAAA